MTKHARTIKKINNNKQLENFEDIREALTELKKYIVN